MVYHSANTDCHNEHGGIWRYCQNEYGRYSAAVVLLGRKCVLVLFLRLSKSDVKHVYCKSGNVRQSLFPRLVVPISTVLSNLLRFGIQLALFIAMYIYFFVIGAPMHPNAHILLLPVLILMMAGLGLGFGILISSMTTKYRDLTILFTFIVQLWMYATPIVYPISMVPEGKLRTLIMLNPMSSIIEAFKYSVFGEGYFSWGALSYSFIFMSVLLILGIVIFNRVQRSFMDTV